MVESNDSLIDNYFGAKKFESLRKGPKPGPHHPAHRRIASQHVTDFFKMGLSSVPKDLRSSELIPTRMSSHYPMMNSSFTSKPIVESSQDMEVEPKKLNFDGTKDEKPSQPEPQQPTPKIEEKPYKINLEWKKYLNDDGIISDTWSFQNWDKSSFPGDAQIEKDISRTRTEIPVMKQTEVRKRLRDLAAFYCILNSVDYQQGLCEIIAPFLLLKSTVFRTADCFAYLNSFMRNYFTAILTPKKFGKKNELPHLQTAYKYCDLIIQYHCAELSQLFKMRNIDIRMFATSWIMTLFIQGTPIDFVYEILDQYIQRSDKTFFFYLVVALLKFGEERIFNLANEKEETILLKFLNMNMKNELLTGIDQIRAWFRLADGIKATTPKSFEVALRNLGFMGDNFMSAENWQELLSSAKINILYVFPAEAVNFIIEHTAMTTDERKKFGSCYDREIEFRFLDIRRTKEKGFLPFSVEVPSKVYKDQLLLQKYLTAAASYDKAAHICIMRTNNKDETEGKLAQVFIEQLMLNNKNCVSVLYGGFQGILREVEKRKVNIELFQKESSGFFGAFGRLFG